MAAGGALPRAGCVEVRLRFTEGRHRESDVRNVALYDLPGLVDALVPYTYGLTVEAWIGEEDRRADIVHDLEGVLVLVGVET